MVPERMVEQTKQNVSGIHDNRLSGNATTWHRYSKKTAEHRKLATYLTCNMKPKGDGWAGNEAQ